MNKIPLVGGPLDGDTYTGPIRDEMPFIVLECCTEPNGRQGLFVLHEFVDGLLLFRETRTLAQLLKDGDVKPIR